MSNNSLNKHLQGLYRFMEYLRETGKIKLPHLEQEREEANSKAISILSPEEIQLLYNASEPERKTRVNEIIGSRDKAMLSIYYSCGLRRNEGSNLNLSDINFESQLLHVRKGKGNKERFVPFNKHTLKQLENYIYNYRNYFVNARSLEALFVSVKGNRINGQSLYLRLKVLQEKSGNIGLQEKDICLHTLRHSIASYLLKAGMSLDKIAQFLGHSSLESTQIYTHLVDGIDKQKEINE